jgi:hypothetical protein
MLSLHKEQLVALSAHYSCMPKKDVILICALSTASRLMQVAIMVVPIQILVIMSDGGIRGKLARIMPSLQDYDNSILITGLIVFLSIILVASVIFNFFTIKTVGALERSAQNTGELPKKMLDRIIKYKSERALTLTIFVVLLFICPELAVVGILVMFLHMELIEIFHRRGENALKFFLKSSASIVFLSLFVTLVALAYIKDLPLISAIIIFFMLRFLSQSIYKLEKQVVRK